MKKKLLLSLIAVCSAMFGLMAQNKTVTGTVTGADGAPIAGATVVVEGTSIGTTTDAAGHYTIAAPSDGELSVSFIGYQDETIAIAGKTTVDVVLEESHTAIDNVIVVAFGQTTKEAFTGSAKVVTADELSNSQVSNAINALNGKVAGVQMSNSTGSPADDGLSIRIRGFSSITASNSPLIVLDGIPYNGSMNNINPADIESMTVLKDAASNALYGSRGANGVIMITTKRAKSRDAVVNVDMKWGVNQRASLDYDVVTNPAEYYEMHYQALYNSYIYDGATPAAAHAKANANVAGPTANGGLVYQVYTVPAGQFFIGTNGKLNPNATLGRTINYNGEDYYLTPDNWTREVLKPSLRQEYNASVNGGTDKAQFYTSFGYLNNKGIVEKTNFERITGRLKAEYQAKRWLKVGANAAYTHYVGNLTDEDGTDGSSANIFAYTSQMAPIYPLYVRDGNGKVKVDQNGYTVYDYGMSTGAGSNAGLVRPFLNGANPVSSHLLDVYEYNGNALNGNAFVDVTILKELKATFNVGLSLGDTRQTNLTNAFYGQYASSNGIITKYHTRSMSYNFQQLLDWSHSFGEHNLDIMVGHENYAYNYAYLYGSKNNMFSPDNLELAGAITVGSTNSYTTDYNTEGYFGRLSYDWDNKIYVSGSYRRDASSRFHPDNRWGNFWSVGAAYVISNEEWWSSKWLNMLKFKASYGSQGNDGIGNYLYTDTYDIVNSGGEVSLVMNIKGNKDITWETNGNFNAGIEFDMFNGRFGGTIEGFYRKTTDMLSWFTVPPSMGYTGYYANVGDMVNKGLEVELYATPVHTKHVTWTLNANLTWVRNRITKLAESRKTMTTPDGYNGYASGSYFYGEGLSLYSFYMQQFAGVEPETGKSMWYMDVKHEDGTVTRETTTTFSSATEYICGNPLPDAYGGFGTTLEACGFDITVNFVYQLGGKILDSGYSTLMNNPTSTLLGFNYHRDLKKAWTPENTDTDVPAFRYGDLDGNRSSDRFLISGSYLGLQNLNFGYTFPHALTKKISIDKLRLYVACENVWLWSKRKGLDPRQSLTGGTYAAAYSAMRTISGGINITF